MQIGLFEYRESLGTVDSQICDISVFSHLRAQAAESSDMSGCEDSDWGRDHSAVCVSGSLKFGWFDLQNIQYYSVYIRVLTWDDHIRVKKVDRGYSVSFHQFGRSTLSLSLSLSLSHLSNSWVCDQQQQQEEEQQQEQQEQQQEHHQKSNSTKHQFQPNRVGPRRSFMLF